MHLSRSLVGCLFCCCIIQATYAFDELPKRPVDLSGRWILNSAQSDDAEAMLRKRLEKQRAEDRKRLERWRSRQGRSGERPLPPIGEEGVDVPAATRDARARVMRRRAKEEEQFRRMLGITRTLDIRQDGRRLEVGSAIESRRFDAGTESQVSMPEGQLADLEAGWDGEWFVARRHVRSGPRVVEKFRLIRKTGQLEYQMHWSGDTELSGMKVKRVFDRAQGEAPVRDPNAGPVR